MSSGSSVAFQHLGDQGIWKFVHHQLPQLRWLGAEAIPNSSPLWNKGVMEDYFLDLSCRNRQFSGSMLIWFNLCYLGNGSHHVESFWQRTASKKCVQSSLSCVDTSMLPIVHLHHQENKINSNKQGSCSAKAAIMDFRVSYCQVNTLSTSTIWTDVRFPVQSCCNISNRRQIEFKWLPRLPA